MIILELFSGTESFSKVAQERKHKSFTIDFDKKFNPNLCIDISLFNISMLPEEFRHPDVVWASPPCTEYSHAKSRGIRNIQKANEIVLKTLEIIKQLKPKFWIIENPQTGFLKSQEFMKEIPFTDVSYCKYGFTYRKQTRLWNNFNLKLKTCNKDCNFIKDGKHIGSAGNGRKKYTDKNYSLLNKYAIPKELCLSIIKQIEEQGAFEQ
jgi:site-specific DNA-cytosine methylase